MKTIKSAMKIILIQILALFFVFSLSACGLMDNTVDENPSASSQEITGVVLHMSNVHMGTLGSSLRLKATVSSKNVNNGSLIWTSSDPSVATVSSLGIVTSVSEGTAIITATTQTGNFSATCIVTVGTSHT